MRGRARHTTVSADAFLSADWERRTLLGWLKSAGPAGLSDIEITNLVQQTRAIWSQSASLHLQELQRRGQVVRREDRWFLADPSGPGPSRVVVDGANQVIPQSKEVA